MPGYWVHGSPAGEILKIDSAATNGLLGVEDSLAYRIGEVERHLHSYESWFGAAVVPNGEIHVADRIGTTAASFQADAGNDTWGTWLQILGSSDTPARAGNVKFDLHRIVFTAAERTGVHFIQISYGASGAAGLAAGEYTEIVLVEPLGTAVPSPVDLNDRRSDAGTKTWLRVFVPGQNTGTLNFFIGVHEYEG